MRRATILAITDRAAGQHGLITMHQLQQLGVGRPQRRRLVDDDWLEPVAAHVYGLVGTPASFDRDLVLGRLCIGPDAVVSHCAAAWMHGLDVQAPVAPAAPAAPAAEFTVPRHRRNVAGPFRIHSTGDLPAQDRTTIAGHPCTSIARTVLDLAGGDIDRPTIEAIVERAMYSGACDPHELSMRLSQFRRRGRPGVRRLDAVLVGRGHGDRRTSTRRFLALVRDAGLPRPRPLEPRLGDDRERGGWAQLALSFDDLAVGVVVTSGQPRPAIATVLRDDAFGADARVYTYSWDHVRDRPDAVTTTLRTRLLAAGWGSADTKPGGLGRVAGR